MIALVQRLDLRTQQERVYDAQRDVMVTGDALRAALTLTASGGAGERRSSVSSASSPNGSLNFNEGSYRVGLDFDLPWDKVAERNAYRKSLIGLERTVRELQSTEDQIKLDVRSGLRALRQARASYRIQVQAVRVAKRRVESTDLFMQAGRAEIRDVLDAQESLTNAQDALTSALVSYRISTLELQRDLGVLKVNENGLWQE